MRTAFVFDRSRETALSRAHLVSRALEAAAPGAWIVEPVTSRNRLLADIGRCPNPRSIALIDLADNERNIVWRLGDRIIATVAAHPDLRARCTAVALTAYGESAVAAAIRGVGGAGLIDATELLVGIDEHAAAVGALLVDLADNDRAGGRAFVRWPPAAPLPPVPDADARVAEEFERWFGRPMAPWHLEALASLAVGKGPSRIAVELVELEHHASVETATKRVSELNAALARSGPGPTIAETASRFLTQIAYLALPGPSTTNYPDVEAAEAWFVADGRVRRAAWLLAQDESIFDAVRHHHRVFAPEPRAGNRRADARDRRIIDACRAAAESLDIPVLRVFAATERTLRALHDAHADYCESPQVELGHAIRELQAEPMLVRWRERNVRGLTEPVELSRAPDVLLEADGRVVVEGNDADTWECSAATPRPGHCKVVDGLRADIDSALGRPRI